jgi:hypothetical protein
VNIKLDVDVAYLVTSPGVVKTEQARSRFDPQNDYVLIRRHAEI